MRVLDLEELNFIGGGRAFFTDFGFLIGGLIGAATATQLRIDAIGDPMLGAMSQGA